MSYYTSWGKIWAYYPINSQCSTNGVSPHRVLWG